MTKLENEMDELKRMKELKSVLVDLPHQLEHSVMIPIGEMAFTPGKIIHSNEILVPLGDQEHYALQTSFDAIETLSRQEEGKEYWMIFKI